jgi:Mg2+ and Co2+ transporter CorA
MVVGKRCLFLSGPWLQATGEIIASIYGMNFEHMPELKSEWGYPIVLGVMGLVAAGMLIGFRRRKWL